MNPYLAVPKDWVLLSKLHLLCGYHACPCPHFPDGELRARVGKQPAKVTQPVVGAACYLQRLEVNASLSWAALGDDRHGLLADPTVTF